MCVYIFWIDVVSFFFFKQKTAYEMRISDWSSDVCSSDLLTAVQVRSRNGELVPLSNLVTLSELAEAGSLNRFNRLRAITISAGLAPGYTMGEALEFINGVVDSDLPDYAQVDWKGESREYQKAGGAVLDRKSTRLNSSH